MNLEQLFHAFQANANIPVDPLDFLFNLLMTIILAWLLGQAYTRFGTSLSNRQRFASTFVLLAMTTMVIITIVKSSLTLSLGLVGALSIVRFRSAIKEPEELVFLFITIGIGLGMGANHVSVTLLAFLAIIAVVVLRGWKHFRPKGQALFLQLSLVKTEGSEVEGIISLLQGHCQMVKLKRLDEVQDRIEAAFLVNFKHPEAFHTCRKELLAAYPAMEISFMDQ